MSPRGLLLSCDHGANCTIALLWLTAMPFLLLPLLPLLLLLLPLLQVAPCPGLVAPVQPAAQALFAPAMRIGFHAGLTAG
jgi:hypothetical protein